MYKREQIKAMIERMRLAYDVDKSELPKLFNCKENTINNWAHFGRIPHEQLEQCSKSTGQSMDWLLFGVQRNTIVSTQMASDIKQLIHRVMGDAVYYKVIAEARAAGVESVADKIATEITGYLNKENSEMARIKEPITDAEMRVSNNLADKKTG